MNVCGKSVEMYFVLNQQFECLVRLDSNDFVRNSVLYLITRPDGSLATAYLSFTERRSVEDNF